MTSSSSSSSSRRRKDIPRLPLAVFDTTAPDATFPVPPTPSLIVPNAVIDAHHHPSAGLEAVPSRARVRFSTDDDAHAILAAARSTSDTLLIPFALDSTTLPDTLPALTTTFDGTIAVAADSEEDANAPPEPEIPVKNLRWALQHTRVVDIHIQGGIMDTDPAFYDSLVNLLAKSIKSEPTPVVLTNVLPPPLDPITPVVTLVNHPAYLTYRQRVSSLSLSANVSVKLLPPAWVPTKPIADVDEDQVRQLRDILKLFIVPVLEAFGFERILFGSCPSSAAGSPALASNWYKLVVGSFRELAVSQDEMDKIFFVNAERVYCSV